jgi:hypothetical protein
MFVTVMWSLNRVTSFSNNKIQGYSLFDQILCTACQASAPDAYSWPTHSWHRNLNDSKHFIGNKHCQKIWLVHQFEGLTDTEGCSAVLIKLHTGACNQAQCLLWVLISYMGLLCIPCRPLHSSILNLALLRWIVAYIRSLIDSRLVVTGWLLTID